MTDLYFSEGEIGPTQQHGARPWALLLGLWGGTSHPLQYLGVSPAIVAGE